MNKIIGILMIFGCLVFSIGDSARQYWQVFIHFPSLLFVCAATLGFMVATAGKGDWRLLLQLLSGKPAQSEATPQGITTDQGQALCMLLLGGARFALICGFIGTIIGLIVMLMNMDAPSAIGPALAYANISLLYGGILSEFVLMLMYRIAVRRYLVNDSNSHTPHESNKTAWQYCGGGLALITISFLITLLSMSEIKQDKERHYQELTNTSKTITELK